LVRNAHRQLSHRLTNDDTTDDTRFRLDHSARSRCFRSSRSLRRCWYAFSCSILPDLNPANLVARGLWNEVWSGLSWTTQWLQQRFVNDVVVCQLVCKLAVHITNIVTESVLLSSYDATNVQINAAKITKFEPFVKVKIGFLYSATYTTNQNSALHNLGSGS